MFSIGITTFKRRYEMVEKLIKDIKTFQPKVEIILTVNADYKEPFDDEYRKKIMDLCMRYENIFPVVFPQFTGLSKMWNTIVLNASSEYVFIMNDDLQIEKEVLNQVNHLVQTMDTNVENQIIKINQSFSHFLCSKALVDEVGYFDERFLAFGEEDGDFTWRYIHKFHHSIRSVDMEGIENQAEGYLIPHPNMEVEDIHGTRFVPKFNRDFANKKYKPSIFGTKGMFDCKKKRVIKENKQYPYENFKKKYFDEM